MFTVVILAGYVLPQFKPLFEELERRPAAAHADDAVRRHASSAPVVHPASVSSCSSAGMSFWLFNDATADDWSRTD